MTAPLMSWLCVHTDATVVISLIVTVGGALAPSTVISAMAPLSPALRSVAEWPPVATR